MLKLLAAVWDALIVITIFTIFVLAWYGCEVSDTANGEAIHVSKPANSWGLE